jgi:tetratricopeptide (TPR) repeat protein
MLTGVSVPVRGEATMRRSLTFLAAGLLAAGLAAVAGCTPEVSPEARQLLESGKGALRKGDGSSALRDLDAFLRDNSESRLAGEAYYYRGQARLASGDRPGARADLSRAAGLARDKLVRAEALLALGELTEETGDLAAAQRLYQQSVDDLELGQVPADEWLYRLGCALQKQGRWAEADPRFDRVIYLFAGTPLAREAQKKVRCAAWTIRVASLPDRDASAAAAAILAREGLPASVRETIEGSFGSESQPAARLAFAVQVGRYATYAQAAAALPEVRAKAPGAVIVETR